MAIVITDLNEFEIGLSDGFVNVTIWKQNIRFGTITGDILPLMWHNKAQTETRYKRDIDWNDVTAPVVVSAAALQVAIEDMIKSAWGGSVTCAETIIPITGNYTLQVADACNLLEVNDSGYGAVEITIPPNSSEAFAIGESISFYSITTENVDFIPDVGVTLLSFSSHVRMLGQYSCANLTKIDTDTWVLCGDIKEAYDNDAQAFIDAIGTLDETQQDAVNQLVLDLKSDSIWTKMKAIYPFVGASAVAHKFNLKDPQDTNAAYRLVFGGSPTHSASGVTFNGTTQYAITYLTPSSNLTAYDTHMSFAARNNNANAGTAMGLVSGANVMALLPRVSNAAYSDCYNQGLNRIGGVANTDATGIYIQTRTSSTVHKLFKNASQLGATDTDAASNFASVNINIYIGCWNLGGSPSGYYTGDCTFATIGDGLTDADCTALTTAIQTFNAALGR